MNAPLGIATVPSGPPATTPPPRSGTGARAGLTEAEARHRRERGEANTVTFAPSRTYRQIVRDNALMSINVIIFVVGVVLIAMGLFSDALVTVGLVLLNVLIAVAQETRAKRALDRIALLTRAQATVLREGAERGIDPAGIVLGDLVVARAGDQVMVDGKIVANGNVAIDESLLTGEAEPITRSVGDPVLSGSFVVSGAMTYEAERVGMESEANRLTARARAFQPMKTPVQREVDLVLRLMVVLILVLGGPILLDLAIRVLGMLASTVNAPFVDQLERAYQGYSLQETVRAAAVVVSIVPQGLALMLTVSYALGAVRLAGQGTLLQQANAIESLSHVDVLCFDKTGTLTTNRLTWHATQPIGVPKDSLEAALGDYAASTAAPNRTIEAIAAAFPGRARPVRREISFSSTRKWSAIQFDDDTAWVLGAPDVLLRALAADASLEATLERWTAQGLRVLLLARGGSLPSDTGIEPHLPADLAAAGVIAFRDELQPHSAEVIQHFGDAGVTLKIISGDHTETVAALARQAGFGHGRELRLVSGLDLATMDAGERAAAARDGDIFGRITPDQKRDLIRDLQEQGRYVAMVGDGVNDVLALKQAQLGIAMEAGSQASRAVADVVLLGNAFTVLPAALQEGQRIVRASQDLLKLFLSRSLSMAVVILGAGVLGAAFPLIPTHNALPAFLTIGIPTLALAAWARPGPAPGVLLRSVLPFAIPAALSIGAVEGLLYITYLRTTGDIDHARTVLTTAAVLCGLLLILFVEPPTRAWTGGDTQSGDWRPVALVVGMLAIFVGMMLSPAAQTFLELAPLSPVDLAVILPVVGAWAVGLRHVWRAQLMRRWLGLQV